MDLVGVQLGHYKLTKFIKGGGMGEVYLAEDLSLPRQVAIKVMKSEGSLYPNTQKAQEAERLFQREMRAIAMLDHPNILTLCESGKQKHKQEQIDYMVMPYCPAGSLADWIKKYHADSSLTPQEISRLLTQAAAGLQHAHDQNILHLDIKPQNFLVRRQQDPKALPNLLLADFGVAKITNTARMSGTPRGTFLYMAPEQLANNPVAQSDQYALAIMVYELLTGKTPFNGVMPQVILYQHAQVVPDPPSKVDSSLPQVLDTVILRALAKRPEARFRSVTEFAQAFATALKPGVRQQRTPLPPPQPGVTEFYQQPLRSSSIPPLPSSSQQRLVGQQQQSRQSSNIPPPPPPPSQSSGVGLYQQAQQGYQPYSPQRNAKVQRQRPAARKGGFWWALVFSVIAGVVYKVGLWDAGWGAGLYWSFYYYWHLDYLQSEIFVSVILCAVPIIAGFIVSKIVRRKRVGTLTGAITWVAVVVALVVNYHLSLTSEVIAIMAAIIVAGALLGFVGGWIASWGTKW